MRLKRSMIVAMTIMRMMEMPVNQIVYVISVRNSLMPFELIPMNT